MRERGLEFRVGLLIVVTAAILAGFVFVLGNMTIGTFYFMAGLVLLEKGDGVLEGLIVTPLRLQGATGSWVHPIAIA